MTAPNRLLYLILNLAYGMSIGSAAALWAYQTGAWTGQPSGALLAAGSLVLFGSAYVATVTARGQRPTIRGVLTVAGLLAPLPLGRRAGA